MSALAIPRVSRLLGLLSAVGACVIVSGCSGRSIIDCAGEAGPFIGTVVARHGDDVTFRVESIPSNAADSLSQMSRDQGTPVVSVGRNLPVHYGDRTGEFVHVGTRYSVRVFTVDKRLWSEVHKAGVGCSDYTRHADGSSINTSLWTRSRVRGSVLVFALVVLITATLVLMAFATRNGRRRRRIQRRNQRIRSG
jgi:hypothetical protein